MYKDSFYCGLMGKREQCECCKRKESRWRRGVKEGTTVDILTGTNKGRVAICKATILKVCGE